MATSTYDKNTDYQHLINEAVKSGDYQAAALYEQQRNAKIDNTGITDYNKTNLYSQYLNNSGSGTSAASGTNGTAASGTASSESSGVDLDKNIMSDEDYAQAQKYKEIYNYNKSIGNMTVANQAHEAAEALRAKYGYSGGATGSQYTYIGTSTPTATTTPNYTTYESYGDLYDNGYDEAASSLASANAESIAALEAQAAADAAQAKQDAADQQRQRYIAYMRAKATLPQQLSAAGYTGGMADSQKIALETNLQNNQNAVNTSLNNTLSGINSNLLAAKANQNSNYLSDLASIQGSAANAYDSYVQNQNSLAQSDYYTNTQNKNSEKSEAWQQAYNLMTLLGYATPAVAAVLGIPAGTLLSSAYFKQLTA